MKFKKNNLIGSLTIKLKRNDLIGPLKSKIKRNILIGCLAMKFERSIVIGSLSGPNFAKLLFLKHRTCKEIMLLIGFSSLFDGLFWFNLVFRDNKCVNLSAMFKRAIIYVMILFAIFGAEKFRKLTEQSSKS